MTGKRTNPKDEVFYCYVLLDPRCPGPYQYGKLEFSHEPFYVGKGTGSRASSHLRKAALSGKGNRHKQNKIKKIQRDGYEVIIHMGNLRFTERDAHKTERKLIALIGRSDLKQGPLTNLTDGGEGSVNVAEPVRKSIARSVRRHFQNMTDEQRAEFAAAVSEAGQRIWKSKTKAEKKDWHGRMRAGQEALSDKKKREWRKNQGAAIRAARACESEEAKASRREKFSATRKADPNWGSNISRGQAAMSNKARKQMSSNMRAAWANREPKQCPHCGTESINYANLTRWHFDNCKERP